MSFPCPKCGKPTRVCQDPALRICAICRKVSPASECTVENAPVLKRPDLGDRVRLGEDEGFGWVETTPVAPVYPCSTCRKETKEHSQEGFRICRAHGMLPLSTWLQ